MDKGTLKQLQNLINRTNVPKVVKSNYSAASKFYLLVLEAHIVCAGMQFFRMECQSDAPKKFQFPADLATSHTAEKKAYLNGVVGKFVNKFALGFINDHSKIVSQNSEEVDDPQLDEDNAVYNYASAVMDTVCLPVILKMRTRKVMVKGLFVCGNFFSCTSRKMVVQSIHWRHLISLHRSMLYSLQERLTN